MREEKQKIISDICPFYKEYGTCEQCNTNLDIDDAPCYFECMANAIINNGYRKQEWISVDERLPEVGDDYLIVLKEKYEWEKEWRYHVDVATFTIKWDCIFNDWDEGQEIHITHWMPLPEAPKMKGGADKPKVTCLNCKHLMFSDMYGECNKQLRIVNPSDTCEYAEPKERGE